MVQSHSWEILSFFACKMCGGGGGHKKDVSEYCCFLAVIHIFFWVDRI